MTRHPDWQKRLNAYLAACGEREFAYGQYDCGQFVLGALEATTGSRPEFPLSYGTRKEAFRAIRQLAGAATLNAIAVQIGRRLDADPRTDVAFAQRGNPVLLRSGSLGLIDLNGRVATPSKRGLTHVDRSLVHKFWNL